jgi:hypothetical protein
MSNLTETNEWAGVVEEFRRALAEMPTELADRFCSDRDVFMKMVGGTEEDAERIAEKNQFCLESSGPFETLKGVCPKVHDTSRKVIVCRCRSGRTDLFDPFFKK